MKKIIDSVLISEKYAHIFEQKVAYAISQGFQPYGDFTVKNVTHCTRAGSDEKEDCFILFMVKYED